MLRHLFPSLPLASLLLALAGCDASPAPGFFGATRHEVTLQGIRFAVLQKEDRAEVIRLNHTYLSLRDRDRVPALMLEAVEETTGCRVKRPLGGLGRSPALPGDTGEARFDLDCPDG